MSEPHVEGGVPPSGTGCVECLATDGWWFHLRRCVHCGHIGCCDSSPSQHASRHAAEQQHPIARSFEPGEDWFWDYANQDEVFGPELVPPLAHPLTNPHPDRPVACRTTGSNSCTDARARLATRTKSPRR